MRYRINNHETPLGPHKIVGTPQKIIRDISDNWAAGPHGVYIAYERDGRELVATICVNTPPADPQQIARAEQAWTAVHLDNSPSNAELEQLRDHTQDIVDDYNCPRVLVEEITDLPTDNDWTDDDTRSLTQFVQKLCYQAEHITIDVADRVLCFIADALDTRHTLERMIQGIHNHVHRDRHLDSDVELRAHAVAWLDALMPPVPSGVAEHSETRTVQDARESFAEVVTAAQHKNTETVITRYGTPVAKIVPVS